MNPRPLGIVVSLALVALAARPAAVPDQARAADNRDDYAHQVVPLLTKYCYTCHAGARAKGEVNLEKFRADPTFEKQRELWEKVSENLRSGEMPPRNKTQPTAAERERLIHWIDSQHAILDRHATKDPGRVTMRRLNRTEYDNTIRDLLGVDFHPAADFPADDVGYGFDNIGDVLTLPPLLMERYLDASEKIARRALVTPENMRNLRETFPASAMKTSPEAFPLRNGFRNLHSNGEVYVDVVFPREAEYTFRIRAYGDQAGKQAAHMVLRVGSRTLKEFDVAAENTAPAVYEFRGQVPPGSQRVAAAFTNDYLDKRTKNPRRRDRNLHIASVEVEGPHGGVGPLPESHRRLMIAVPKKKEEEEACARQILTAFVSRAYRRPARTTEVERLVKLVALARRQGDSFERGIQLTVQAVLTSPYFLFRVELDPRPRDAAAVHFVNDYELASRLSYFLWSSMPDAELFEEARKGTLRANVGRQVRRLLQDPKAGALVENFAGQWLGLRGLKAATPDVGRFPAFDEKLRAAMACETEMFFAAIMRQDRSVLEFIDADYTFLNERLAKHYGIPGVRGETFQRVALTGGQRGGVLTQASVLTATSNPTRTSPVKRGKWILENILGAPPPPPPPDVPDLNEGKKGELAGSMRQRMEQHRANAVCASCHQRMDPLGFGFENYDAIGAWRTRDGKFSIDPAGVLPGGKKFQMPAELKAILKSRKGAFSKCLAEKMLTYALGRGLERYDRPAVDRIAGELARHDYRFTSLVVAIVESDPFLQRRGQK